MIKIDIKPLSVNEAWKGKRFKTDQYKDYESVLMWMLPRLSIPEPPLKLELEFGFSNSGSDWDNPIKPFQDILQKKYGFNDKDVFEAVVRKFKVPKGKDYLKFKLTSL